MSITAKQAKSLVIFADHLETETVRWNEEHGAGGSQACVRERIWNSTMEELIHLWVQLELPGLAHKEAK